MNHLQRLPQRYRGLAGRYCGTSSRCERRVGRSPKPAYSGQVFLAPRDGQPSSDAVCTDDLIRIKGGTTALHRGSFFSRCQRRIALRSVSSLPCPWRFQPPPSFDLIDSLNALRLISSRDQRPAAILACAERVEMRLFLDLWQHSPSPPTLETVKAGRICWK